MRANDQARRGACGNHLRCGSCARCLTVADEATVPTVSPYAVTPNPQRPGWVMVWVCCPHCGKAHMHGGPSGDYAGHRSADCGAPAGYHVRAGTPTPTCSHCGGAVRGVRAHPSCVSRAE